MKNKNDLTQGSILKVLIGFAVPYLFASFMQAFYGAVDLLTVGQFSGTSAISAVNIGSQIMQIMTCFVIGISMGTTVILGQNMGRKNEEDSALTIGTSILLFLFFAIILTPLMLWQAAPLVNAMQTPVEAMTETVQYVWICSLGLPCIIAFNVIAAILRGMGDSKTPMIFVGIACVINVAGDCILVGAADLGVRGAAAATIAAQGISAVCGIIYLMKKGLPFPFKKSQIKLNRFILKKILYVGIPIALQDTLINISFMVITVIANNRGVIASSAVGVVEKIIMFMFLIPSAMLSSISAITAQNIGAAQKERAIRTLKYGIIITTSFGILMCAFSQLIPDTLTGIFSKDERVVRAAGDYLRTYSIDCILVGITFCVNGYLCGIEKSFVTFIHNIISIFMVRIPAAYLMSITFRDSLMPMGLASPAGSMMSIIILGIYFLWQKRSNRRLLT